MKDERIPLLEVENLKMTFKSGKRGKKVTVNAIDDNSFKVYDKKISPLFVMPEYRGKGVAQRALQTVENIHGSTNWQLDTILQEKGNCHLYEKMGYRQTGETRIINDKMTLVFYKK